MIWQDFFKLAVAKVGRRGEEIFFWAELKTPEEIDVSELFADRLDHLKLNQLEKKKYSLGLRKILACHELFETDHFKRICRDFKATVLECKEKELIFSTQGGGIYLFLSIMNDPKIKEKKIICYTSELPLGVATRKGPANHIQFIYRPHAQSYLSDFSTLWKESEYLSLFELKDFKASA